MRCIGSISYHRLLEECTLNYRCISVMIEEEIVAWEWSIVIGCLLISEKMQLRDKV